MKMCEKHYYCMLYNVQQDSSIDLELVIVLAFLVKNTPENFVTGYTGMPNAHSTSSLR